MAFQKKSVGITPTHTIEFPAGGEAAKSVPDPEQSPYVGEERNGRIWDGKKWTSKATDEDLF